MSSLMEHEIVVSEVDLKVAYYSCCTGPLVPKELFDPTCKTIHSLSCLYYAFEYAWSTIALEPFYFYTKWTKHMHDKGLVYMSYH